MMKKKLLFLAILSITFFTFNTSAQAQSTLAINKDTTIEGSLSVSTNLSVGNRIIIGGDEFHVQAGSGSTGGIPVKTSIGLPLIFQKDITLLEPDQIQELTDEVPMFTVDSQNYPNGITIVQIRLATDANSTLTINVEEWTEPDGSGTETTIDNIATAASDEQTETAISDGAVAAGTYVFLDLDTTDVNWAKVTVWYYVND